MMYMCTLSLSLSLSLSLHTLTFNINSPLVFRESLSVEPNLDPPSLLVCVLPAGPRDEGLTAMMTGHATV